MRTASTIHLVNGEWVCTQGPVDVPAKNGMPADRQRELAQDVTKWPAGSSACILQFSDGRIKRYYRSEAESLADRTKAFRDRAEMKQKMAVQIEADRKNKLEALAAEAGQRNAEANAKAIAEKEQLKAKLLADRDKAEASRVQQTKTTNTTKPKTP